MNWDDPTERLRLIERVGTEEYNRQLEAHQQASVVDTVNGHFIRPVGTRFGRLYSVVGTDSAFPELDQARDHAQGLPAGPETPQTATPEQYEKADDICRRVMGLRPDLPQDRSLDEWLTDFCDKLTRAERELAEAAISYHPDSNPDF